MIASAEAASVLPADEHAIVLADAGEARAGQFGVIAFGCRNHDRARFCARALLGVEAVKQRCVDAQC